MSADPLRVAYIGVGSSLQRSDRCHPAFRKTRDPRLLHRSTTGAQNFSRRISLPGGESYEALLADREIEAIVNTTPNDVRLATTRAAAPAASTSFSTADHQRQPRRPRHHQGLPQGRRMLTLGYQRGAKTSPPMSAARSTSASSAARQRRGEHQRDRLGKVDLSSCATRPRMPGGVMLQIGIHTSTCSTYLIGPVHQYAQSAQLVLARRRSRCREPDPAAQGGALSTLNASYASASEYYLMDGVYGKDMTTLQICTTAAAAQARESRQDHGTVPDNDTLIKELENLPRRHAAGPTRSRRRGGDAVAAR